MRFTELEIISSLQSSRSKATKEVILSKVFDLDTIELEQYIDPKRGKIIKKYSSISFNSTWYKVNKPYLELKEIVVNRSIPVLGFANKSKRFNNGQKKNNKSI